jgi:hypothetical protein
MLKRLLNLALAMSLFATANSYAQYVSTDCPGASAGTPVGPTNTVACPDNNYMSEAAATIPTTGQTNYSFIVTSPAPDNFIIGSTDNGVYDFSNVTPGVYGLTGITYNLAELNNIASLVCALTPESIAGIFGITLETATAIDQFICGGDNIPDNVALGTLLGLLDLLADNPQTIDSVAVQLQTIVASVDLCYATSVSPAYTITVSNECSVGIEGINGLDNIAVLPTVVTDYIKISGNVSKAQDLTIEISDLSGRNVATYNQHANLGNFNYEIALDSNVPSGYLLCTVRSSEGVYTTKLLRK